MFKAVARGVQVNKARQLGRFRQAVSTASNTSDRAVKASRARKRVAARARKIFRSASKVTKKYGPQVGVGSVAAGGVYAGLNSRKRGR